jgi:hypothetical protein
LGFGFGFGFGRLQRHTRLKPQRGRIRRLQPTAVGATRASVTQPQSRFCEIMLEKGGAEKPRRNSLIWAFFEKVRPQER